MKLLILDGNSVLHRAYYALPDWRNRSGEATAGVYGFLSILLKSIEDLKPTHLAIVFDDPSPTFRHLMYVGYQTNREKDRQISEDIWGQIDKLKVVFEKVGIQTFQLSGFEADDIIGTIGTQATSTSPSNPSPNLGEGGRVIIITGDRDLMQLVNDQVNLYMSFKGISDMIIVDRDRVKERLGIWPEQVIDYKALVGDSSDNYPGIPGIGPVMAKKLIEEFGSFEKIYESLSITPQPPLNLRGGVNSKLIDGYESGELSKRLATIKTDVPITFTIANCLVPNASRITEVLQELGYKSLIRRVAVKSTDEDSSRPRLF
ncbi:MAG: 5'-3' exonuclease H3TH domain-containing protein [Patescibacteria group bacterium]